MYRHINKTFEQLLTLELFKIYNLRSLVFVVEQNRKKIVFVIRILRDYIIPKEKITKVAVSGNN